MRFSLAFGILGAILVALAWRLAGEAVGLWWALVVIEGYLAACFLTLAALYGLRSSGLPVEALFVRPGWSWPVRAILLPYLALGGLVLWLSRWIDREDPRNSVAPRLLVGRLPFPSERSGLREAGINAVLNLCWEFPRLSGLDREPGLVIARVPILDGSAPSERQFREAVDWVAMWHDEGRTILIHCAQGHGRSATIAAVALLRLGLAADPEAAQGIIRAVRPRARPSREQKAALMRYASRSRVQAADGSITGVRDQA